ncbi:hypothetical protein V8D89_016081 [Ganoderma adspersum]
MKGEDIIILSGSQGRGWDVLVEAIEMANPMVLMTKVTFLIINSSLDKLICIK